MDDIEKEFLRNIKYLYAKYHLDIDYNVYIKQKITVTDEFILRAAKGFIANFTKQVNAFDDEDQELMKIFGYFV